MQTSIALQQDWQVSSDAPGMSIPLQGERESVLCGQGAGCACTPAALARRGPSMALTVMREPGMSTTTFLESSSPSRYRSLKES